MSAMKSSELRSEFQRRAVEALKSALSSVSSIKLVEIRFHSAANLGRNGFLALVDVCGRLQTLACEVRETIHPVSLLATLARLHKDQAEATPLLIAPYLSAEVQSMCKQSGAAYLDLEGNARILLGEVFIGKRSAPLKAREHVALEPVLVPDARILQPLPAVYIASNRPALANTAQRHSVHPVAVA
jgi:hypothetical protein